MSNYPEIQIKRKITGASAPYSLLVGELAFNAVSNFLYIGNTSSVKWIGAEILNSSESLFTSDTQLATRKAISDNFVYKIGSDNITITSGGEIRFVETGGGSDYVAIRAPSIISSGNVVFTLPGVYPPGGSYVLSSTVSGVLDWVPQSSSASVGVTTAANDSLYNIVFTNSTTTVSSAPLFIDNDSGVQFNPSTNSVFVSGNLGINGGTITSTATTFNLLNTTVTNANVLGAADTIQIGSTLGNMTIRNAATDINGSLRVAGNATFVANIIANGGTITSTATTFNLLNTTVTNANVLGAARTIVIGAVVGATTTVRGNLVSTSDFTVNSGNIFSGLPNGSVFNFATGVVSIGLSSSGVWLGNLTSSSVWLRGGTIEGSTSHQNVFATALTTTVSAFSSATDIKMGADFGATYIKSSTVYVGPSSGSGTISTQGAYPLYLQTGGVSFNGSNIQAILTPDADGAGQFRITGGDLYLGIKTDAVLTDYPVNIIFEGTSTNTSKTTLTVSGPTANRTITLPDATGTLALISGSSTQIIFNDGGSLGGDSGLTYSKTSSSVTISGNASINGGTITSTATTFNLLNTTVTNANVLGAANVIQLGGSGAGGSATIRNAATAINGTLTVTGATVVQGALSTNSTLSVTSDATFVANILANGGTITSTATTFNLLNTTVTNANVLGAADTIQLGSTLGSTTIRNAATAINGSLTVTGNANFVANILANGGTITSTATTFNLLNTTVTNASVLGAADTIQLGSSTAGGSTTIRNAATAINGTLTVTGATVVQGALSTNSTLSVTGNATFVANILANGGTITSTATTFNLLNTTVTNANIMSAATTVNAFGAAVVFSIGSTAKAISETVNIFSAGTNGGTYNFATGNSSAFASTKTVNIGTNGVAGSQTNVNIGQSNSGTSTIISPTVTIGQGGGGLTRIQSPDARFDGNILALGGTITSNATTFNLLNTTVTNANVLGAANTILLGGTLGSTTIRNAATSLNGTLSVTGNATFVANIIANGGTITSIATTFNLLNTTVTNANVLGAADTIVLGGTLGSLTIRNLVTTINGTLTAKENATFISSIVANGGTITSTATTFDLLNTTVTNANVLGDAGTIVLGRKDFGSITIRNAATAINGTLTVTGATVVQGTLSTNSTLSVTSDATFVANILANGGTITSTATTFNLLNTTVTNANVLGAANTILLGGNLGSTTIRNAATAINGTLTVTGNATFVANIIANGGTITSTATTFNLLNTNVTNANVLGAASVINIGLINTSFATRNISIGSGEVLGATTNINLGTTLGGTITSCSPNFIFLGNINANSGTITSTATTFNLLNTTVTNANVLGASSTIVMGANSNGSCRIRNLSLVVGGTVTNTTRLISTQENANTNHLQISPYGILTLNTTRVSSAGGTFPYIQLNNEDSGNGSILLAGSEIYVGTKDTGLNELACGINFIDEQFQSFYARLSNGLYCSTNRQVYFPDQDGIMAVFTTSASSGLILISDAPNYTTTVTSAFSFSVTSNTLNIGGNIAVNGGTVTSTATTFNLLNTTVTNANVLGSANTILLGGTLGSTTIRNAATAINGTLTVTGAATFQSNISAPNIVNSVNGLTGTVVSPKTYLIFSPLDNQPPASNFATIDTRNSIMVLEFDAATDESAVFVGVIPEFASLGSGLKVRIHWMADTATSGTCRWGVQIERMNTDLDSDSFDTAATAGSTTNATSGIITTTEITITTIDGVTAGDPFRLKVYRDADGTSGTDDMLGDAQLVVVEIRSGV